jgi:hypothetical protein
MSSTENKSTWYVIGIVLILLVLAPMAWFRTTFGFDVSTAFSMTITEILFSFLVISTVCSAFLRLFIFPHFLWAAQYLCWIPAFNYWSDKATLGFGEKLWFAQGWVQVLIFLSIFGLSFLIKRVFNSLRYWLAI